MLLPPHFIREKADLKLLINLHPMTGKAGIQIRNSPVVEFSDLRKGPGPNLSNLNALSAIIG